MTEPAAAEQAAESAKPAENEAAIEQPQQAAMVNREHVPQLSAQWLMYDIQPCGPCVQPYVRVHVHTLAHSVHSFSRLQDRVLYTDQN